MKELKGLAWEPSWMSIVGCIKGCLNFKESPISMPWLYGGSGFAFSINIAKQLCPSGPTAWRHDKCMSLLSNLGVESQMLLAFDDAPDYQQKQIEAQKIIVGALDNGIPSVVWSMSIPEYYVIYGYDDSQYFFDGPNKGAGVLPFEKLGKTEVPLIHLLTIDTKTPESDAKIIKDTLEFAVFESTNPASMHWHDHGYAGGLDAYELWAQELEKGDILGTGAHYNAQCWAEARKNALLFLNEAMHKLPSLKRDFENAVVEYGIVENSLSQVAEFFPFFQFDPNHAKEQDRVEKTAELLRKAKVAETRGIEILKELAGKL